MMKKILVVDDERDICQLLKDELSMEGYQVYTAVNGAKALQSISKMPDLILLDINMPEMDGYSVCEKIRNYISCPILFLTARTEEADCIRGFRVGADDYITKPFHIDELLERVAAHLRREERHGINNKIYMIGDLTIDVTGTRILKGQKDVKLTRTEFQIVEFLLINKGQVFDKERIYEETRGYDGNADASIVTEHIRRIRNKLGRMDNGQDYIQTVWGVGYKWIG